MNEASFASQEAIPTTHFLPDAHPPQANTGRFPLPRLSATYLKSTGVTDDVTAEVSFADCEKLPIS